MDVAKIERIENDIDQPIERCSKQKTEANELAEVWADSERKDRERRRREDQVLWYVFFANMADSLHRRAEEYDRRAETLCEEEDRGRVSVERPM